MLGFYGYLKGENIMDTKLVFCIECGEMVHLEEGIVFGHLKYIPVFDFDEPMGNDVDLCEFPSGFAFVAPPDIQPDWIDHVVETREEVLEFDVEVLLPDMVGA